jgi:hypothetical protein
LASSLLPHINLHGVNAQHVQDPIDFAEEVFEKDLRRLEIIRSPLVGYVAMP